MEITPVMKDFLDFLEMSQDEDGTWTDPLNQKQMRFGENDLTITTDASTEECDEMVVTTHPYPSADSDNDQWFFGAVGEHMKAILQRATEIAIDPSALNSGRRLN